MKELKRKMKQEPYDVLHNRLSNEENPAVRAELLSAVPDDTDYDRLLTLVPLIEAWTARHQTCENPLLNAPLFERVLHLFEGHHTLDVARIIINLPYCSDKIEAGVKAYFKGFTIALDDPRRDELLEFFCNAAEKRKRCVYPVLKNSPGITGKLVRMLTRPELKDTYQWDEILDLTLARRAPDLPNLLEDIFTQIQSPKSKMTMARHMAAQDKTSKAHTWYLLDRKNWEALRKLGDRAVDALEYGLALAGETANNVKPPPPYDRSDIQQLLELCHKTIPQNVLSVLKGLSATNNLKPVMVQFLIKHKTCGKGDPEAYIQARNELVVAMVTAYIEELEKCKDFESEREGVVFFDPKTVCKDVVKALKILPAPNKVPDALTALFRQHQWLHSHQFWDGTTLFSQVRHMGHKFLKKINWDQANSPR